MNGRLAKKQTNRNVYRCHVIGPRDAGKTTFCQGLLERSLQDIEGIKEEDLPRNVINTVQVYGQEKYLILQDIDVKSLTDMLSPIDLHCDVCCLVYDISNPRSFEFAARIFLVCFEVSFIDLLKWYQMVPNGLKHMQFTRNSTIVYLVKMEYG